VLCCNRTIRGLRKKDSFASYYEQGDLICHNGGGLHRVTQIFSQIFLETIQAEKISGFCDYIVMIIREVGLRYCLPLAVGPIGFEPLTCKISALLGTLMAQFVEGGKDQYARRQDTLDSINGRNSSSLALSRDRRHNSSGKMTGNRGENLLGSRRWWQGA